jgi:glyoxylase-like metal-dependent hydrolase (beta-lactamase superfamily II)
MKVERIIAGPLQSNCYIVYDEKTLDAMVVDPGDEPEKIIGVLDKKKLRVGYIVCTHGHFDHVGAVSRVKDRTGAKVVINKDDIDIYSKAKDQAAFWGYDMDSPINPDMFVGEDDELSLGGLKFKVMLTPGHSPGGICLYGEGIVLTGDTVFAGSVGRTDLFGGSMEELKKSFTEIMSLPPGTKIFPGHGEWSTVQEEKEHNFFIHEL